MTGFDDDPFPDPDAVLLDGGTFRLYSNRIEEDRGLFLRSTDVTYYSDVTSAQLSGRLLTVSRNGTRRVVVLQFRRKEQARIALHIINLCKQ
ncbi:hypothetical protein Uis1B_1405 [Bifidobacterium margollesii]|uniref:Uncharacterized protein n=1 Tax=Bifidobacterium margollesii TaxID=2020964 RepID=A0A2N5J9D1_9BIFI|nr:hypothetical protein [Bifidobacterium margollesii]PLS30823.1 hypothetical protein Uis1B_1405 [Bifidobacterium margollesii]